MNRLADVRRMQDNKICIAAVPANPEYGDGYRRILRDVDYYRQVIRKRRSSALLHSNIRRETEAIAKVLVFHKAINIRCYTDVIDQGA